MKPEVKKLIIANLPYLLFVYLFGKLGQAYRLAEVESIEAELAETEQRIAAYDAKFAAATTYEEADYKAYDELKSHYDHLMHEWEKASYELEITENE